MSWWELGERHADQFPLAPTPAGLSVEESVAYWLNQREVHGRTPAAWISDLQSTYDPTTAPAALPSDRDLATEVVRLYALLDIHVTPALGLDIENAAAGLEPALAAPFAGLVAVLNDAYAEQLPRSAEIVLRIHTDLDVDSVIVTPEERDAMTNLQDRLLDAFLAFRDATAGLLPTVPLGAGGSDPPLFVDPEGLVYLGGMGDGTYAPTTGLFTDAILIVEPAGNDLYTNNAGGACPDALALLHHCNRLAIAAVFDMDGDDDYLYNGVPYAVQGAGSTGGVGMLVDLAGDDEYRAHFVRGTKGAFFQYLDGGAQGFAQGGSALLLDAAGNDVYEITVRSTFGRSIWGFGQGFGSLGSLGVSIDLAGDDHWIGLGLGGVAGDGNFQGLYPQGTGFYGGIGIILDLGMGADVYYAYLEAQTVDYYAQGFGAFGGLGIQYEDGGHDSYYAVEKATNPWIEVLLNCAFGTASLGGVGVFIEVWGDDSYFGDTISPGEATTMNEGFGGIGAGYGLHVDLEGDDHRDMQVHGAPGSFVTGRGHAFQGGNQIGNYLDAGGVDTYAGGPGSNDAVWLGGADRAAFPGGILD